MYKVGDITDFSDDILYLIANNLTSAADLSNLSNTSKILNDALSYKVRNMIDNFKWVIVAVYSNLELMNGGEMLYLKVYIGDTDYTLDDEIQKIKMLITTNTNNMNGMNGIEYTMVVISGVGGNISRRLVESGKIANISFKFNRHYTQICNVIINDSIHVYDHPYNIKSKLGYYYTDDVNVVTSYQQKDDMKLSGKTIEYINLYT